MALVNPNIAMSFRMPEFTPRNALAEYAQIQQIQGGQRQAEMADMQLAQMRQKEKAISSIQAKAAQGGGPTDRRAIARAYIDSGDPEFMKFGLAMETTLNELDAFAAYQSDFAPKAQNALGASPTGMDLSAGAQAPGDYTSTQTMGRVPGVVTTPIPESPPMNAMAPAPAAPANAMAGQPDVAGLEARYRRVANIDTPGAKAEAALLLKQIERAAKTPEIPKLADRFVPVGKLVFDRETQQYISPSQTQLAQSQERSAAGGAGGTRESAPKPMTPVQSAKRRDQLGKEFKAAQSALQTTQDVLDSIAFVKSEPGLSRATGFIGTMLPSMPEGAAASAETRLKNLEGKVTALGKAAASATGSVGSIAIPEWKIMRDMIAAIDPVKGTGPLLQQIDLIEAQAQGALERIRDGYRRQFGDDFEQFPQFADLPAPRTSFKPRAPAGGKPAAGGGLSAAEQAELDQLRKRFGK
jgi:hypothetical protein